MKRRPLLGSLAALSLSAGLAVVVSQLQREESTAGAAPGAQRVISLSPALTESVVALSAAEQLVGVSEYCDLPPTTRLPRVGTALQPDYEAITALRPSLILSDDSAAAKRRELIALGPAQFLPWLTLDEVVSSTLRLGQLLAHEPDARELARRLRERLSRVPPSTAPRVLLLLGYDAARPAELWFIKRNSLHGAALSAAGGQNAIARDVAGEPRLSLEELIQVDPEVIVLMLLPDQASRAPEQMRALSALVPLHAVKTGRIGAVVSNHSVGPRILELTDALQREIERLARRRIGSVEQQLE